MLGSNDADDFFQSPKYHFAAFTTRHFERRGFIGAWGRSFVVFNFAGASRRWSTRGCQRRVTTLAQDTLDGINENTVEVHHGFLDEAFFHEALILFFGGRA